MTPTPPSDGLVPEHFVRIEVDEEDTLKRYRVLNKALTSMLYGVRLVRILEADYESGRIDMVVEAAKINPGVVPSGWEVRVDSWPLTPDRVARGAD